MKFNKTISALFLAGSLLSFLSSCTKADSEQPFGFSKIYMPQAISQSGGVNNNYPVPFGVDSSSYNYAVDDKNGTVNVILGAMLSGPETAGFSVRVAADADTIAQMLSDGTFDPATHLLMPASMYTLPETLTVPAGARSASFNLALSIEQLKDEAYGGKTLLLAVEISDPSNYELNTKLNTTIVVLDREALVIGPAVNVTSEYIKNPGNPFIASAMNGSRWGTLADWKTSPSVLNHGGVGGFCNDGDGQTMNMESGWGSPQILNGKIYQTVNLPAGSYSFNPAGGSWIWQGLKETGYIVAAPGAETIPDYAEITTAPGIVYATFTQPQSGLTFTLDAPGIVTLGVVVNYIADGQGFKSRQVQLFNYPKAL